ncbi:hypothetical protein EJ05DRAFT_539347 [Pseudovirgaria hyperparasitica]|uniref:Uncharacterized protein n=1 Tax=Pseudovirgaria hyperparasitica TaxID=470096 RepID=A0A6A6W305_9PEZI|nr:uncharacterized protein EJ05DRAFT_539347 [Pseudovirgaria hyperparasitica]KAF2756366.1 hypothetical protein EJ05DRAFT_539347 [Pseudovirgaria hyperparasitica]
MMSAPSSLFRHTIFRCSQTAPLVPPCSLRSVSFTRKAAAARFYASAAFRARKDVARREKYNAKQLSAQTTAKDSPLKHNPSIWEQSRKVPSAASPRIHETERSREILKLEPTSKPLAEEAAAAAIPDLPYSTSDAMSIDTAVLKSQNVEKLPSITQSPPAKSSPSIVAPVRGIERLLIDLMIQKKPLLYEAPNQGGLIGACVLIGFTLLTFMGGVAMLIPEIIASEVPGWAKNTYIAVVGAAIAALGYVVMFAPANMIKNITLVRSGNELVLQARVMSHLIFRRKTHTRIIRLPELSLSEPVHSIAARSSHRLKVQKAQDQAIQLLNPFQRSYAKLARVSWNIFVSMSVAVMRDGMIDTMKNGKTIGKLDARGWCAEEGKVLDRIVARDWSKEFKSAKDP